jgi:molybdopterin converting factor subunit 1
MTVRVLLFASYADALGASELNLDLPDGARVADLMARVKALASGHAVPDALVAVNQRYATADDVVSSEDEVAIIPPVAGG